MESLKVLSLKDNRLLTKEAGKALAEALATNSTLSELDVSSNNWRKYGHQGNWMGDGPGFAEELAVGIKDNRGLSKLICGGDQYWDSSKGQNVTPEPAALEVGMSDADFSYKNLGAGGAIVLSAWLTHKDAGALTKLDISNSNIQQGEALQRITDFCNTKGIELDSHESESEGDDNF
jgi:hypothetical protein